MKTLTLFFLILSTAAVAKFQYVSPMPGSGLNNPEHNIILREGRFIDPSSLSNDLFVLQGSKSGIHSFRMVFSDDHKTILLYPDQAFGYDEDVSVSILGGIRTTEGKIIEPYSFSFTTHREYSALERESFKNLKSILLLEEMKKEGFGDYAEKDPAERQLNGSFTIVKNTNPAPGNIFYDAWNGGFFGSTKYDGYNIITPDGDSVYASEKAAVCFDFSINPNGHLSVYNDNFGRFDVLDSNYALIDSYYPGNGRTADPHEFTIYPDGHAFMVAEETHIVDMTIYNPNYSHNATLMTTIVQEFDQGKNVIFEWRGWDHIIPTESNQNLAFGYIDVIHTNSIELDTDGNIICSNRHLNQVNKIDRNTGDFIWRLGGVMNEFTFINEPEPFSFEHDARRIANGNITVWDNGNGHVPTHSAAKEYQLDEINKTATLVWSFNPQTYSGTNAYFYAMGSAQRLENGNTLVNGGWDNSSNQSNMWEVTPAGEVVWELKLDNSKSLVGYRALKYTWNPCAPVNSASIKAKGITSNSAKITWKAVNDAVSYDVQYRKSGQVNWKQKNTVKTNKSLVNLLANKSYEYQVRTHCLNGYTSDWSPIKTFTTLPQRLMSPEENLTLQLYPNPTHQSVTIDISPEQDQTITFSVIDLSGKRMFTSSVNVFSGEQSIQFDLSHLPAGAYLAEVQMKSGNVTVKFVKE
jgi:hypothetical protein